MKTVQSLKKLVVLHLYYHELWKDIKPYLLNLKQISDFDLYVTVTYPNEVLFEDIKQFGNVQIYVVENEGADLYPFFYVLDKIDLDSYDILYKIHSKRNVKQRIKINGVNCGLYYWRECMFNDILGKKNIVQRLQDFLDDENLGASGYYPYLISYKNSVRKFYGGTIFMARSSIFKCFQHKFTKENFVNLGNERFSDFTYDCERMLGTCVADCGYTYRKGSSTQKFLLKLLSHRISYSLYRWYVDRFILAR